MENTEYDPKNFREYHDRCKVQSESKWNALSKEDQLDYFCAVVRRIHEAEVERGCSYRTALYEIFGFDRDAYGLAQMSGYLDLHNMLYNSNRIEATIEEFCCNALGISPSEFQQVYAEWRSN